MQPITIMRGLVALLGASEIIAVVIVLDNAITQVMASIEPGREPRLSNYIQTFAQIAIFLIPPVAATAQGLLASTFKGVAMALTILLILPVVFFLLPVLFP